MPIEQISTYDPVRQQVVGVAEAAKMYDLSVVHFRRLYRKKRVPQPFKAGERKLGWVRGTLLDDIAQRAQQAAA